MKKVILMLSILGSAGFFANAQTLPANVSEFLKKNYPNWEVAKFNKVEYQENKSTAHGDFDGDGKTDYAVAVTKDDRYYVLALLKTKGSFKSFNLLALKGAENAWIAGIGITAKGQEAILNPNEDSPKPFRLKTDGIAIYDGEGMTQTFFWQDGKFKTAFDY